MSPYKWKILFSLNEPGQVFVNEALEPILLSKQITLIIQTDFPKFLS